MIGRTLSHYKVLEEISRGGMGIVYKALDLKLNREVALKVLPPELVSDPDRKRRFVQEAQAAAALKHPNIATMLWLKLRALLRSRPALAKGDRHVRRAFVFPNFPAGGAVARRSAGS